MPKKTKKKSKRTAKQRAATRRLVALNKARAKKKRAAKKKRSKKKATRKKTTRKVATKKRSKKKAKKKTARRRNPAQSGYIIAAEINGKLGYYTGSGFDTSRAKAASLRDTATIKDIARQAVKSPKVKSIGAFSSGDNAATIRKGLLSPKK